MSEFKVGDIVEWNSNRKGYNAFKGDKARVTRLDPDGEMVYVKWITKTDQNDGGYNVLHFDLVLESTGVYYDFEQGKQRISELLDMVYSNDVDEALNEIKKVIDTSASVASKIDNIQALVSRINRIGNEVRILNELKDMNEVFKAYGHILDDATIISCFIGQPVTKI